MMRQPDADVNIIDPRSIWRLWIALQDFTVENDVRKNPPTSGFIGEFSLQSIRHKKEKTMKFYCAINRCMTKTSQSPFRIDPR